MKLDKRIIEGKRPLTCLDIEQAREFVGKECIFSDSYDKYQDIEEYTNDNANNYTAILSGIDNDTSNGDYVFNNPKIKARYRLILPLKWVKEPEKKYRPFTLDEFVNSYSLGDEIILRIKENNKIEHKLFIEYVEDAKNINSRMNICLGGFYYSLKDLFDKSELYTSKGWKPFGIEVEE